MSSEDISEQTPALMRQARKAVNQKNYKEGLRLYDEVLAAPDMQNDLDLKLRLAWCAEQVEEFDRAIKAYQQVYDLYIEEGEHGPAASLKILIEKLELSEKGEQLSFEIEDNDIVEDETDIEALDDAALFNKLCAISSVRHLSLGDVLCSAGDMPKHLWLMRQGGLIVNMPDYEEKDEIHAIKDGLVLIGEIGLFTGQRRNATLIAHSDIELHEIEIEKIRILCDADRQMAKSMDRLLRERWVEPVLANHRVFERINEPDRKRMAKAFERCRLQACECLIQSGEEHDGVYLLQSGCLFFMHAEDGLADDDLEDDTGGMISVFPGDMVHLGGLLHGYKSRYRIVAATPVQLLRLTREAFEVFSSRRPWIIPAILKYGRRPPRLQVMHPEDDYRWDANREVITLHRVGTKR